MRAAGGGHLPLVLTLIEKGADVDAKDKGGDTALMGAARGGHLPLVLALIEKGADVEAKTYRGVTAADCAKNRGHAEVERLLRAPLAA